MTRDEARSLSVNHGLDDEEITGIEACEQATAPGAWYAPSIWCPVEVRRYDGTVVNDAKSVTFMARAKEIVPRLIRHIRALEDAWRSAKIGEAQWKREYQAEVERHRATTQRSTVGETGPEEDLPYLVEACEVRTHGRAYLGDLVRRWALGESVRSVVSFDIESARKREQEHRDFVTSDRARAKRKLAEVVGRDVDDEYAGIVRGMITAYLDQPRVREDLRAYLSRQNSALFPRERKGSKKKIDPIKESL